MPTIHREFGFQVIIRTDDHSPPHVHVRKGGGKVEIWIGDGETAASVKKRKKIPDRDVARALEIVDENWERFLEQWEKYHGETAAD